MNKSKELTPEANETTSFAWSLVGKAKRPLGMRSTWRSSVAAPVVSSYVDDLTGAPFYSIAVNGSVSELHASMTLQDFGMNPATAIPVDTGDTGDVRIYVAPVDPAVDLREHWRHLEG